MFQQVIPDPRNRRDVEMLSKLAEPNFGSYTVNTNEERGECLNYAEKSTETLLNLGSEKSTFVGNKTVKTYEVVLFDLCSLEENSTLSTPAGRIVRLSPN